MEVKLAKLFLPEILPIELNELILSYLRKKYVPLWEMNKCESPSVKESDYQVSRSWEHFLSWYYNNGRIVEWWWQLPLLERENYLDEEEEEQEYQREHMTPEDKNDYIYIVYIDTKACGWFSTHTAKIQVQKSEEPTIRKFIKQRFAKWDR